MHKTLTQSHGHATHWVPGGHIDVLHTLFPGGQCGGFAQYWLHPTSMKGAIQKKKMFKLIFDCEELYGIKRFSTSFISASTKHGK